MNFIHSIPMIWWIGIGFIFVLLMIASLVGSGAPIRDLHGSAAWAKINEIRQANLLKEKGVYVGGFKSGGKVLHLRDDSNTHLLCYAPTRAGKGVSLILPTLLTCEEKSFFVYDIKGENYALSSGWRKQAGNRIIKLELASANSNKYNPLDELEYGSNDFTKEVQQLASILTSSGDGKNSGDHWEAKARETLTALIIYTMENPTRERSLFYVGNLLTDPTLDIDKTIQKLIDSCQDSIAKNILVSLKNTPDKERGSVISTLRKSFELFADPIIKENTSKSDFKIKDLVNGPTPCTLYFVVQPNDLNRLAAMVRTMVTQLFSKLIVGMEFEGGTSKQKNTHQLILMLDEFASMKYMPAVEEGLAFIAGYGVRAYLIVQDLDQIHKFYGRENGIIGNCHTQIAFAPNSNNTADYLVKQLGRKTIVRKKTSHSRGKGGSSKSTNTEEVGRELLTVDEVRRLKMMSEKDGGETLILRSGDRPILGTRVVYFRDKILSERAKIAPPIINPEKPISPIV
jgi:type IV secretion system protein VirD4